MVGDLPPIEGGKSMEEKIVVIINAMTEVLNASQLRKLQEVLLKELAANESAQQSTSNEEYLQMFLNAKKIEGCSERTVQYYQVTIKHFLRAIDTKVQKISTEEIRQYLVDYQGINDCSKTTVDNIRRNISSFFSWLEEEDYILKSPMRRIHKIKATQVVKTIISDEEIEKLRGSCQHARDLAIIDLLYSTGIRVGELVRLNRKDINFNDRECIVLGLVTLDAPHVRLKISGVEIRLRNLGKQANVERIHPHKFRRTMATRAIDKGMPVEQVQKLLGHSQIDTTMQYAIVNQSNVKESHRRYIA